MALLQLLWLRFADVMYLFNDVMMANDGSSVAFVVNSQDVAITLSLIIVEYHLARNMVGSIFLKSYAEMISYFANESLLHVHIGIIGHIVKLFIYFLLLLIRLFVYLRVLVSAHDRRMESVCFAGLTHFLHLIIIQSLIVLICDECLLSIICRNLVLSRQCHQIKITRLYILLLDFHIEILRKVYCWAKACNLSKVIFYSIHKKLIFYFELMFQNTLF